MTLRIFTQAGKRLVANFFLKDRSNDYRKLLQTLAEAGYRSLTLRELVDLMRRKEKLPHRRVFLRHDIDTDAEYVPAWLDAESRYGFRASYYFRLRTLDFFAMTRIEAQGGEASYHFEELASVIRRRGIRRAPIPDEIIEEARSEFEENFSALQRRCNWPLRTVAAHGDFVNRKLGVTNCVVTDDKELRTRLGIEAEAYDQDILAAYDMRFSDCMGPSFWRSVDGVEPLSVVRDRSAPIQILTHPRHWRSNARDNLREDADRAISGLFHMFGVPSRGLVDYVNRRHRLIGLDPDEN